MNKFDEAIRFATKAHAGMERKAAGIPFITHPMEVAVIVSSLTQDEDVLCAAMLHDVVEDTPLALEDIRATFGDRVAELVELETEDKHPEIPKSESWRMRKEESLAGLKASADRDVHILWLADKLANMRSYARLHARRGNDFWKDFNQSDPAQQAWYYREIAEATKDLSGTLAWQEYDRLMKVVFEGVL